MRPTASEALLINLRQLCSWRPRAPIQPSVEIAAPLPTGRILQSLVEPPAASDTNCASAEAATGRPRKVQGSQSTPTLEVPCDPAARSGNVAPVEPARCIVPPIDGIAVSAGEATRRRIRSSKTPAFHATPKDKTQGPDSDHC